VELNAGHQFIHERCIVYERRLSDSEKQSGSNVLGSRGVVKSPAEINI